ncbi:MAG: hypothetical protein VW714_08375, partial [Rhodospirillales bacterium]
YRSPQTEHRWTVPGIKISWIQQIIQIRDYLKLEKEGKIWLMHRRVGNVGENTFELMYKEKKPPTKKRDNQSAAKVEAGKGNLNK